MARYLVPLVVVQCINLVLLWLVFRKQIASKKNILLKLMLIGFSLYLTALLFVLLNPTYYYRRLHFSTTRVNLIPFTALKVLKSNPRSVLAGIILFIPLGFFIVIFRSGKSIKNKLFSTISASLLLSLTIEIAQMWTGRTTDIDDIILNVIGALIGAGICILQQILKFDKTKLGKLIIPTIPEEWKGKMHVQIYCNILGVLAFVSILVLNYIVTLPDYKTYTYNETTLKLEARNILLWNETTKETLFAVEPDEKISSASTMKILAVLTALDYVDSNDLVTVGVEVYAPPFDSSRAGIEYGMKLTVHQLIEGAMLPSGADAIYVLGTYCGRKIANDDSLSYKKAMEIFTNAMNEKAISLGATNTNVVRPDGYDANGQYITVNDLLIITKEFLNNEELSEICNLSNDLLIIDKKNKLSLTNTNQMIQQNSSYYNSSISGVKTGTTEKAGNCLVSVFTINGEKYICIVMGSSYDGKFRDTQRLFEFAQKNQ